MTTPAQDAPLVYPAVAFRPVRLFVVCLVLTGVALLVAGFAGHVAAGAFFGLGLGLGLVNALLVRRAVESITAHDHPLKKKMALNSASRLAAITIVALVVAFVFRPAGLGVLFGLALFQVVLVLATSLPVYRKLRAEGSTVSAAGDGTLAND